MDDKQCILVVIGATENGVKELVALAGGFRKSDLSWTQLLQDLKGRGLEKMSRAGRRRRVTGFLESTGQGIYGDARRQQCWVHKIANILNKLPKSLQLKAKAKLQEIWMARDEDQAQHHFDDFIKIYGTKYPKATDCLEKDRDVLLTFYDFPAEHWRHIRTTDPIESTFATVSCGRNGSPPNFPIHNY